MLSIRPLVGLTRLLTSLILSIRSRLYFSFPYALICYFYAFVRKFMSLFRILSFFYMNSNRKLLILYMLV